MYFLHNRAFLRVPSPRRAAVATADNHDPSGARKVATTAGRFRG